jgi:hypothetical protein
VSNRVGDTGVSAALAFVSVLVKMPSRIQNAEMPLLEPITVPETTRFEASEIHAKLLGSDKPCSSLTFTEGWHSDGTQKTNTASGIVSE